MKKIAVIGAGMAGAGAAWKLRRAGYAVTVFEKEAWAGGRAHTFRGEGFQTNTGAGFFTNFYPRFRQMLSEMKLEGDIVENPKVITLATPERLYDYKLDSVVSFLQMPWLSLVDKMRVINLTLGLTLRKGSLDLADVKTLVKRDRESIAEYARRKVGERAYQYLLRSMVEPYWYFSSEEVSASLLAGLQSRAAGARFFTLQNGVDQLAVRMMEEHTVHYSTSVDKIRGQANGQLLLHCNGHDSESFDGIVIATTASVAGKLISTAGAGPWGGLLGFLNSQQYAANINAYFMVPKALLNGFSPQTSPCGPGAYELAAVATHGSRIDPQIHPGKATLGVWLSDQASRSSMNLSDTEIAAYMWELVRRYRPNFPSETPPMVQINRRTEAIPLHATGRYRQAADAWKAQRPPIVLAGDYLSTATMEGALNSGYLAAEILINAWN
jgi:oxygen-dependent protoporphyrinogen oxidase